MEHIFSTPTLDSGKHNFSIPTLTPTPKKNLDSHDYDSLTPDGPRVTFITMDELLNPKTDKRLVLYDVRLYDSCVIREWFNRGFSF